MPAQIKKTPKKKTVKKPKRQIATKPLVAAKKTKFSAKTALAVTALVVAVGVVVVAFSQASGKPYSRLDCVSSKNYMGVVGPQTKPPIPGYRLGKPSRQACLDGSAEAMVAKAYLVLLGTNSSSLDAFRAWTNQYIGFRANPPVQLLNKFLATEAVKARYGRLSDSAKVDYLYLNILGRSKPDAKGKAYWLSYLKKHSSAETISLFLRTSAGLRAMQPKQNAYLATLPASYYPLASTCGRGYSQAECDRKKQAAQNTGGVPCKAYSLGGNPIPVCSAGTQGGVSNVLVDRNIDGSNVTLNKAMSAKFKAMRQAGKKEARITIAANDVAAPGAGSYRSKATQAALVRAGYPAAPVGRSMHQWGMAIDLSCNGKPFTSSGSTCQNWIKRNAARFGFRNLPSEAWHYSSNGK